MKNGQEADDCAHVCMPTLSVAGLLFLSVSRHGRRPIIHYDLLPRYMRGMVRLAAISEAAITAALAAVLRVGLRKIAHGDSVPGYSDAHLASQEAASDVAEALLPLLRDDPWGVRMAELYGEKPALSYLMRHISRGDTFPSLLSTYAYRCAAGGKYLTLAWGPDWPEEWFAAVQKSLPDSPVAFYRWPSWYRGALSLVEKLQLLFAFMTTAGLMLFKRGLPLGKIEKRRYQVIAEFIDPLRLARGPQDADFFVDGKRLKSSDVLFFLTASQSRTLAELGYDVPRMLSGLAREKGYEFRKTEDYPCTAATLRLFLDALLHALPGMMKSGNSILCRLFFQAWREYLEFAPMFEHCSAKAVLYPAFPTGRTSIRLNSAIVTSLCRAHGLLSVNYQSRAVHSRNHDYCFDCYDLHLAWGEKWPKILGQGMMFIEEIRLIGCVYLPAAREAAAQISPGKLKVCIFPTEINLNGRHHYTLGYALRFMNACVELALRYPDIQFVVKGKDPGNTGILMSAPDLARRCAEAGRNLVFSDKLRHDYEDLMASSDIVIAVGYTTPGTEALLRGKRVIFYDELKPGGQAFTGIPDLTAADHDGLLALFRMAVDDHARYAARITGELDRLDPFRDGQASIRMLKEILR